MFSYEEALNYLDSFINYEKKSNFSYNARVFNLERIQRILRELGNPHFKLKTIHVAGTKGKGSTAAIITSILNTAGYRVGLYTSPHLVSPRERIKIGSRFITPDEFASCLWETKLVLERLASRATFTPSFFEIYTSMGFLYFFQKKIDIAVIEVGLGGRLDATNVIHPLVGIITPISLDHTRQLGSDILSIAREKAGIIKPGSRIITSLQDRPVLQLIEKICQERGATLYKIGEDAKFRLIKATPRYQRFEVKSIYRSYPDLFLPLPGEHQLQNAASAILAVELIREDGFKVTKGSIERGLRKVDWPGRIQLISGRPLLILDCAHNGASARFLAKYLQQFYSRKKLILVLAILKNKDVKSIGEALCPLADRVIVTQVKSPRALPPEEIYPKIKVNCRFFPLVEKEVKNALEKAKIMAGKSGVVVATGSVYLVGEILELMNKKTKV